MFPSSSSNPPDIVQAEIFNLLVLLFSFSRKPAPCVGRSTRHELLAELIAVKYLQDSIVLGLSRLADQRKDVWSFGELIKYQEGQCPIGDKASIQALLRKFESTIKPIRKHHRHERIAHLSKSPQGSAGIAVKALEELTRQAVEVLDHILGAKQQYVLRVGSKEAPINLRDELQI